jgi:CRISPR-associated protein Cas1
MRLLSTLYVVDHRARIGIRKQSLVVSGKEGLIQRVPLKAVDAVMILGGAQISTQAMTACVEHKVRVASLRRNGRVRFVLGGPTSGNVYLRLAQYRSAQELERTESIARCIVAGKLQNCRRLLIRWSWDARETDRSMLETDRTAVEQGISSLALARDGDHIRGIEGDGARRYFKGMRTHLSGRSQLSGFTARTRRPPRDPTNALLSFVYGLLLTEVVGALETIGLDPQIGYLHGVRPGRPSLGLDLMEEFRPSMADRFVVRAISRRQVKPEHFINTPGGACYLNEDGRKAVLNAYEAFRGEEVEHPLLRRDVPRWTLPSIQATLMARHLRDEMEVYPPYVSQS